MVLRYVGLALPPKRASGATRPKSVPITRSKLFWCIVKLVVSLWVGFICHVMRPFWTLLSLWLNVRNSSCEQASGVAQAWRRSSGVDGSFGSKNESST